MGVSRNWRLGSLPFRGPGLQIPMYHRLQYFDACNGATGKQTYLSSSARIPVGGGGGFVIGPQTMPLVRKHIYIFPFVYIYICICIYVYIYMRVFFFFFSLSLSLSLYLVSMYACMQTWCVRNISIYANTRA